MNGHTLGIIGLTLDLVGVLLLGWDLVGIQRNLRHDAEERLSTLSDVFDGKDKLDQWMAGIANRAEWRESQWEEGRTVSIDGTFDPGAARDTIKEITDEMSNLGADIARLTQLQIAAASSDQRAAGHSLMYSYVGLGLIVIGFTIQALGQLGWSLL